MCRIASRLVMIRDKTNDDRRCTTEEQTRSRNMAPRLFKTPIGRPAYTTFFPVVKCKLAICVTHRHSHIADFCCCKPKDFSCKMSDVAYVLSSARSSIPPCENMALTDSTIVGPKKSQSSTHLGRRPHRREYFNPQKEKRPTVGSEIAFDGVNM